MIVSLFNGAMDRDPASREMSWEQFASQLGPHQFVTTPASDPFSETVKKGLPAFSPAEYRGTRRTSNVTRLHQLCLDCDSFTTAQVIKVLELTSHYSRVVFTTWKHAKDQVRGLWRIRICIPFTRPVEVADWKKFYPAALAYFQVPADPRCKNPDRLYFGPFAPIGTEASAMFEWQNGASLDPSIIPLLGSALSPEQRTGKITRERIDRIAKTWKKSKEDYRAQLGVVLERVVKGEAFAEAGERDTTIFQLAQDLAREFPKGEAITIANHFGQSLQMMGSDAPSVEDVASKLERAQDEIAEEVLEVELAEAGERTTRIREAFSPAERDFPYTEAELEAFAVKLKCTREELGKRWIIQRGPQFYCLLAGRYAGPYGKDDILGACARDLAPATSAGVDLWHAPQGTPIRKGAGQLVDQYGSVAQDYILDMRAQEAQYEPAQRLFIEAPCPVRTDIAPEFNPRVDRWLEIMCGPRYLDVCRWMAQVTNLNAICVALFFTGRKGTGKNLFAHGISRVFTTTQPTPLESALAGFNASMARCPVIFGDEQLPKDFRGNGRTAEIRRLISDRSRRFERKYAHETVILGAIRLVVAANNDEILAIQENLTTNDVEAIADRFYRVPVRDESEAHLQTVDTNEFIQGDAIAKHALWLRDNMPVETDGRFLIKSPDREFFRSLTTRTGIRSVVCQWLISYLKNPGPLDATGRYEVRIHGKELLVNVRAMAEFWDTYIKNEPCPGTGKLSQALAGLSAERTQRSRPKAGPLNYRIVDTAHLYAWATETEYASRDEIDLALAVNTENRALTFGNPARNQANLAN